MDTTGKRTKSFGVVVCTGKRVSEKVTAAMAHNELRAHTHDTDPTEPPNPWSTHTQTHPRKHKPKKKRKETQIGFFG